MQLSRLSCAVLGILLANQAYAASEPVALEEITQTSQALVNYDSNKDGLISLDELASGRKAEFERADNNPKDGHLVWEEYKALQDSKRDTRLKGMFKLLDKDGNGKVSSEEFLNVFAVGKEPKQAAVVFAIMDTNSDGTLGADELSTALTGNAPAMPQMWAFAGLDKDMDGKLSAEEFINRPAKLPVPPKLPKPKDNSKPTQPAVLPTIAPQKPPLVLNQTTPAGETKK